MSAKINWIIELTASHICPNCSKNHNGFLPYMCNAVTNGMSKYNHMEFQLVLRVTDKEIARILNHMGQLVQSGKTFKTGDFVSGVYLDCDVRLDVFEESGRKVLRVIIPDAIGLFPEDPECDEIYSLQRLKTADLRYKGGECS